MEMVKWSVVARVRRKEGRVSVVHETFLEE
jgi:hypothetical protein